MHSSPVLELRRVGKRFPAEPPVDALVDVDLTVLAGEWLAIVGPSGSGKSTLLNVLGTLDTATTGSYQFEGLAVDQLGERERAALRATRIGFVFQAFHLLPYRSAVENVMLADVYRNTPRRERRGRALDALAAVGLSRRADFLPPRLSGGERQRVATARALVGSPALLLCDEPTGNIDSAMTESLLSLFTNLNARGTTIVMITHDAEVAARASRRVRITDGRLTA